MKIWAFIFFFFFIPLSLFSFGRRERESDLQNDSQYPPVEYIDSINQVDDDMDSTMKIVGRIQIFGNVPHTYVGIVDEDGTQYSVYPPLQDDHLRMLQGRLVEFSVVLLDEGQGYGSLFLRGGTVTALSWEIIE